MSENNLEIKQKFLDSLKRGTGEAYILLKENPRVDFSRYIAKGILQNYAYDEQSEGSRAQYIYDLICLGELQEKMKKYIILGLTEKELDTWSARHVCDLAYLYFEDGYLEVKQYIYQYFYNNDDFSCNWLGVEEILEMDGMQGLIKVSEEFGKSLQEDSDGWEDSWIIDSFQNDNGEIKVRERLEKEAETNQYVQIYLDAIDKTTQNRKEIEVAVEEVDEYENIVQEVLDTKQIFHYRKIKKLTHEEIEMLASQLPAQKEKQNVERLLEIFTHHKFSGNPELILKYAKMKNTKNSRIVEYATEALKFFKNDEVRQFGLERIMKSRYPQRYVRIFQLNYKKGDIQMFIDIAKKYNGEHIIEQLMFTYCDLFEILNIRECKEPLEILYFKSNCSIHRKELVQILHKNNVLSSKMREELQYDSNLETRELFS